jgi:hypothetical protein
MGGACSTYGREKGSVYRIVVGKTEGKRPLGRQRHKREDIKMDLQQAVCKRLKRIDLAQDRDRWRDLVNAVMNFRVPINAGNFLTG